MKKLLVATALTIAAASYSPAMAYDHNGMTKEEFKKLPDAEKKAIREKKKAEWEKLSKSDKLKVIEEKRAARIKKMDEKWNNMSDDEEIKFVEERHERKGKYKGKKDKSE